MNNLVAQKDSLAKAIGVADSVLGKGYLAGLAHCAVAPCAGRLVTADDLNRTVRFCDITQIVLSKDVDARANLATVFSAVGSTGASLLYLVHGDKDGVSVMLGVKSEGGDIEATSLAQSVLENSLRGCFPGTVTKRLDKTTLKERAMDVFTSTQTVSCVTGVASLKDKDKEPSNAKEKRALQGIEKLIDAMQGRRYTMLLIADPVSLADMNANRRALETLHSSLVPFSERQMTMGQSESRSVNEQVSQNTVETISRSTAQSISHTHGTAHTSTRGTSDTATDGTGRSSTDGTSRSIGAFGSIGVMMPPFAFGGGINKSRTSSHSDTYSTNHSDAHTNSHSYADAVNKARTEGSTDTSTEATATGKGTVHGSQEQEGKSLSMQVKFGNRTVTGLMKQIDKMLSRYDECADLGMFNCAAYFVSDKSTAQMAASLYRSLISGKDSSLAGSAITVWDRERTPSVIESLRQMKHPRMYVESLNLTPGSLVSSAELAIHAGLPYHSVPGIPVIECAPFGRSVSYTGDAVPNGGSASIIALGNIFHMHSEEEQGVTLSVQSLASHTFITGSTGAGKTNTVCVMLDALRRKGVHFLVVEPAKGEYKDCFAALAKAGGNGKAEVSVYGTNPAITPLLRINPFSFEAGIHPLEHLDRLIEVFNVCWPMYAAMPAVLKEAVEKSYEDVGWDLTAGVNKYAGEYGRALWPCFADVCRNVRTIIDTSEYDEENKGAYKGSLVTRLKSLSNGINGMVFTDDEIPSEVLFDSNVIVDLSRVGSMETKALIMGLLVLKLQEHRMTQGATNAELQHVTVLEEAHNLLKRTSTEQTTEGANLIGKSVEMLTNAIAEMRSFGEGFVIADQAPGLLDMAAIRNTNTKIIMRLPDQEDRELVGKAAVLNDDQITELAKLPRGVAAVYQNEWVEAVLCKVKRYEHDSARYECAASGAPSTHEPRQRRG